MTDSAPSPIRAPTAEQRKAAAGQFDRASQVIASGNHDYGIELLMNCCKLDPGNLLYRQTLRRTQKAKHNNNGRGSRFAALSTATTKLKLKSAARSGNHHHVLEVAEEILNSNPWDVPTLLAMGVAFENLEQLDVAVWTLDQARQQEPKNLKVNKAMALVLEKRGNFTQANLLWQMIRKADPTDVLAQRKAMDLAASETIARGNYESATQSDGEGATGETREHDKTATQSPVLRPSRAETAPSERFKRETDKLKQKLAEEPGVVNHYLQLAAVYRRGNHLEEARQLIQQGLLTAGNHFELALELADLEIAPFRDDLTLTEAKLREQPGDDKLQKLRLRLLKEINERELDLYRQKVDRYPTEMGHRFELGLRLLRLGQVDEAIKELQMARTDPRHLGKALVYLGFCFKVRNNWRLAQRNFEEALQHLPAQDALRKDVLYQLAIGAAGAGDLRAAIDWGMELANSDFSYKDIGQQLETWQSQTAAKGG